MAKLYVPDRGICGLRIAYTDRTCQREAEHDGAHQWTDGVSRQEWTIWRDALLAEVAAEMAQQRGQPTLEMVDCEAARKLMVKLVARDLRDVLAHDGARGGSR